MEQSVDEMNGGVYSTAEGEIKESAEVMSAAVHTAGASLLKNTSRTLDEMTQKIKDTQSDTPNFLTSPPNHGDDPQSSPNHEQEDVRTEENTDSSPNTEQQKKDSTGKTRTETEDNIQTSREHTEKQEEMTQNTKDIHSETEQHRHDPQTNPKTNRNLDSERDSGHERTEVRTEENTDSSPNTEQQKKDSTGKTRTETEDNIQTSREHTEKQEEPVQQNTASGPPQTQSSVQTNEKMVGIAVAVLCVLLAVLYQCKPDSPPPVPKEFSVVDVFIENMEKVKSSFPNQRPELWRRSRIHLSRHLKTASPTEPVSLILTSGHGAEGTLGCLAQRLAGAFSAALNSSFLDIYGKSKASQDSDQVKLDIDRDLRKAFGADKLAAVIHRIEELPPGSTLIFYRYCDHENAAYKKVFLVFTVMLDTEGEIPSNATLARVEDLVHEQLQQKFISSEKSAVFNQMDVDKLSGLWSRISHLILPVAAEKKIEGRGCLSED